MTKPSKLLRQRTIILIDYRIVRRSNIMQSPAKWGEALGHRARVDRHTGGRKAAREEAAGPRKRGVTVMKVTARYPSDHKHGVAWRTFFPHEGNGGSDGGAVYSVGPGANCAA